MNININIGDEMWQAIKKNYENENYSEAMLNAVNLLMKTIRNKTGLTGDGVSLVEKAFGGDDPMIKVNKLHSVSEKSIQMGIQNMLTGIYKFIRNPRSHGEVDDEKCDVDAIIIFINYMLSVINKSELKFEMDIFLKKVLDDVYYVKNKEYSYELVQQIPQNQRVDAGIKVISKRKGSDLNNLKLFLESLLDNLNKIEVSRIYKMISEILSVTDSKEDIGEILYILPGKYWNNIEKITKLRIENILFEDVKEGVYSIKSSCIVKGKLGEYITYEYMSNFENSDSWTEMLVNKLTVEQYNQYYVNILFWETICLLNRNNINDSLESYIRIGIGIKNIKVIKILEKMLTSDKEHPWWKVFKLDLEKHTDIQYKE